MRPAGEVRQALHLAACNLAVGQSGATLRELAARAQVGHDAARRTVQNMHRAGHLVRLPDRRVHYRNRPVAVYAPAPPLQPPVCGMAELLRAWTT